MKTDSLSGGFSAPATQAAIGFRAIMTAMARPGTRHSVSGGQGPAPMSSAAATVLLCLCDADTGLFLAPTYDTPAIRSWIAFHLGAPIVAANRADFALGTWSELMPLEQYRIGTSEYPDRSATLIVDGHVFCETGATLRGPGIKDSALLSLPDIAVFQSNHAQFPLGVDFILTGGDQLAALPRSTEVL